MPREATRVFFQKFSRGCQNGEIFLFPLKTRRKQVFIVAIFKIQRARSPVPHISTPMVPKRINATPWYIWSKSGMLLAAGICALQVWTTRTGANSSEYSVALAFWRFFAVTASSEHVNNLVTHAHLSVSFHKWILLSENICVTSFLICLCHRRAPFAKLSRPPVLEPVL